jgi:two-component sensor histidine kinase
VRHVLLLTAVLCSLVGITLAIHESVQSGEGLALRSQTQADTAQLAEMLHNEVDLLLNPLRSIRDRWANGDYRTEKDLAAAVQVLLNRRPIYGMAAGIDGQGICQWARSSANGEQRPRVNLEIPAHWKAIIAEARSTGLEAVCVCGLASHNQPALDVAIPLAREGTGSAQMAPVMIAHLSLERAMSRAIGEHIRREYSIELREVHGLVFNWGPPHGVGEGYGDTCPVQVGSTYWQLRLWPSNAAVKARMHRLAMLVLGGGIVGAVVFTGAMWQVMVYRSREIRQTRAYLQALESMNEIATAISAKLGSGREVLDQLAALARQLLGMSRSGIVLMDEKGERLKAIAFAGDISEGVGTEFALADAPASRSCIESQRILFIEDIAKNTVPINQNTVRKLNSVAIILIPLHIESECIGLMALSDSRPRRFTDAERRLAELLCSQASVILANNRLYEQTHRDAQTQAVLLRELHHRVKNNMAGIVGLLAMGEPDLSPVARQWLNRVIERIRMIARTHDLFSGGMDRIGLRQLIERVLPSLSVIKPPGVMINISGGEVDTKLGTSQAVGLAMVLHELCTNAIQHGLQDRGTLTIQTRRIAGGLAIDIIDDGCGLPAGMCPGNVDNSRSQVDLSASTGNDDVFRSRHAASVDLVSAVPERGLGLRLVRELVGRELRGTVCLRRREEGGTIATIEFPLGSEGEGALS